VDHRQVELEEVLLGLCEDSAWFDLHRQRHNSKDDTAIGMWGWQLLLVANRFPQMVICRGATQISTLSSSNLPMLQLTSSESSEEVKPMNSLLRISDSAVRQSSSSCQPGPPRRSKIS
jgi:hypothetical protein